VTPSVLAAGLTGAAVWLYASPAAAATARLRRLQPVADMQRRKLGLPEPRRAAATAGVAAGLIGGLIGGAAAAVPAGLATGEGVRRLLVARRARAAAVLRRDVADWCVAVAGELRVGHTPIGALNATAEVTGSALAGVLAPVAAVAALGGDVSASLRAAAARPGADALRHIAACWAVAGDVGAGLGAALQRLAGALQAAERVRAEVDAQLAGARASARLLAVLPVLGLLLGQAIGARPTRFLLHTPAGAVCAALTVALNVAGLAWTDRIAARVPVP
jgi:tight adherence protein B